MMKHLLRSMHFRAWLPAALPLLLTPTVNAAVVFTENMGTATSGTTSIALNTFENSGTLTYAGTADTRTTLASSGYSGASGSRNVFFSNSGSAWFEIAGISTTGYSNLALSFGANKALTASNLTELVVEYSTDGVTYSPLTFPAQPTGSGTTGWRLITITGGTIPATSNLRLRWTQTSTTTSNNPRLDDITLTGDPVVASTSVDFTTASSAVAENAGSAFFNVSITNPSTTVATTVDVVLTSGNAARINGFSTVTVTFPANTSADQTVSISITDNAACDGDEALTFSLQNINGGQGTPSIGTNGSYSLTVQDNETPADPVAVAASVISENGFTANWNSVNGATGYFLDVSTSATFGTFTPVTVQDGFDGGRNLLSAGWTQSGLGTDYTTSGNYGISLPSLKFDNSTDQLTSATYPGPATSVSFWYKGQATGGSASTLLTEGYNGSSWVTIGSLTGIANNAVGTQTYALNQNDGFVQFRFTYTKVSGNLSFDDFSVDYASGTPDFVPGYEDLAVAGTSQLVSGLSPLTTYYYRVRSTGGCSTGENSNVVTTTTLAGINPALWATSLNDFGDVCLNAESAAQSFTVNGINLTAADVTVGPLDGFTFSTAEPGTYAASLAISQPGGSFTQEIWVKFNPVLEQSYGGNIPVGGGGAPSIDAAVTGSGVNTMASLSTGGSSNIGMDQAEAAGTIDAIGCSAETAYGIEYSTTQNFTPGTGTQVPSTNENSGSFSSVLTGLNACTAYYFVAYGTNSGGTAYGTEATFTTDVIGSPVATAASGIQQSGFTANWDAVPGALGYRLDVSTSATFGSFMPGTPVTETFTSVGGGNPGQYLTRSWTGVDGIDWTAYKTRTDQFVNPGDDAICLKNEAGAYLESDVITGGLKAIQFDVLQVFSGSGGVLTVKVLSGTGFSTSTTIGTIAYSATASVFNQTFTPITGAVKIRVENNTAARPVIDNLTFTRDQQFTPSFVPGYEDLAVAGTSGNVTGLNTGTTYYYRVRAEGALCTSENSNTMSVTTLACAGNSFVVAIHTDANGGQTSWEVLDENNVSIATGGPYTGQDNTLVTETVCIGNAPVSACYGFHLYDSYGDGLSGVGNWQLRTTDGKLLLGDDFATGYSSPSFIPASPGYGSSHSFCLPPGPANIAPTECGIFNNALGNKVYSNKVTGATQYQFEFSDPDAGFIRRIAVSTNYVIFSQMVSNPLTPGVKYFARVRSNVAGPVASAHWGSGCEMGLGVAQVVSCSQLIAAPAYGHSCNETRSFNTNNSFIYAKPVVGATEYQFRIFNTGEGYDQTFTRSTYILQLKWTGTVAPPLMNQSTYDVQVNVKVNGVYSGFCGNTCTITIDNTGPVLGGRMAQTSFGEATLWPNPVRDGQVNLNIGNLKDAQQQITVDVQDIYGKQAFAKTYGNSGDRFTTILQLPSGIASGVYMVNITVNGVKTVQRLSVMK